MPEARVPVALVAARGVGLTLAEPVLENVDLSVEAGEIVTVVGPNGAGKTSLVRLLVGLAAPDSGSVERRPGLTIGYLPQHFSVDPVLPLTVRRFLSLGLGYPPGARRAIMEEVGVPHLIERQLDELSGGELRRVLLARALLRQPDLLVLDEPVQGVDVTGQSEIYDLIGNLRQSRDLGVLMVSHDLHLVMAATDRVICLNRHVCCMGHPEAVQRHPEYLALFGSPAESLAVYAHHHDHSHDSHGDVVERGGQGKGSDG